MNECIICYNGRDITTTDCCSQDIHQHCLDTWLVRSRGTCPCCRHQLRELRGIPQMRIMITSGNGMCICEHRPTDAHITIQKCKYMDMETKVTLNDIVNGHIIVLTDEDGHYFDILNVPTGWSVNVTALG